MKKSIIGCAVAGVVLFGALPVLASAFSFYEQSAKASGQAGAWIARADDAAANWYNPATLVRLEGTQVQIGLNYLDIGSDTTFTINDIEFASPGLKNGGQAFAPGTTFDSESNAAMPVHLYFSQPINERWAFGIGVTTPFGLTSEWMHLAFDRCNAAGLFAPLPGQPATPIDGVIDGTYRSSIDLLGVTAGLRF